MCLNGRGFPVGIETRKWHSFQPASIKSLNGRGFPVGIETDTRARMPETMQSLNGRGFPVGIETKSSVYTVTAEGRSKWQRLPGRD